MTSARFVTLTLLLAVASCAETPAPTSLTHLSGVPLSVLGPGSYDLPGTNPQYPSGLAYDGAVLWITNVSGDGITYELDPSTLNLASSVTTGGYPRDLTYADNSLFYSDVSGIISRRALFSSVAISAFIVPFRGGAIANDGTSLYIGDQDGSTIRVTDFAGNHIRSFDSGLRPEGMVYDPASGTLWLITMFTSDIYEISTDGVLMRRCDSPYVPGPFGLGGLAIVGNNFWIAQTKGGDPTAGTNILVLDRASLVCDVFTARLTLVKHVVNDDGRTAAAADFTLSASGPTPISGAGGVSNAVVQPGVYTLSESGPAGYSASAWTCTGGGSLAGNQITLAAGDAAVCEITNDDAGRTSIFLASDAGDYIGQGKLYQYDQANAVITITANGGHLRVSVRGDEVWDADFQVPNTLSSLQVGTYSNLTRYPFHNPAVGGLNWSGEGRGCNTLTGSFDIGRVTYINGNLHGIELTFEQHCEGVGPALRAEIHWSKDDPTLPPDPVFPVPAGLWAPAAGATPASGDYVYLESDVGDYIGQGQTLTYTPSNATINVSVNQGHLTIVVNGFAGWTGEFKTMFTLNQLQLGYYPDLRRYPFHNPAKGGLSWSGMGRACNTLRGWFVIDRATYTGGVLTGLDLRFEQQCEGLAPALHGAIHWG